MIPNFSESLRVEEPSKNKRILPYDIDVRNGGIDCSDETFFASYPLQFPVSSMVH